MIVCEGGRMRDGEIQPKVICARVCMCIRVSMSTSSCYGDCGFQRPDLSGCVELG